MFGLTITYVVKTPIGVNPLDVPTLDHSVILDTWQEVAEYIKGHLSVSAPHLLAERGYDHVAFVVSEPQTEQLTYCIARLQEGYIIPRITHANFDLELLNI